MTEPKVYVMKVTKFIYLMYSKLIMKIIINYNDAQKLAV